MAHFEDKYSQAIYCNQIHNSQQKVHKIKTHKN